MIDGETRGQLGHPRLGGLARVGLQLSGFAQRTVKIPGLQSRFGARNDGFGRIASDIADLANLHNGAGPLPQLSK